MMIHIQKYLCKAICCTLSFANYLSSKNVIGLEQDLCYLWFWYETERFAFGLSTSFNEAL